MIDCQRPAVGLVKKNLEEQSAGDKGMSFGEAKKVSNSFYVQEGAQRRLEELYVKLSRQRETYIGYPNNKDLDNRSLSVFLDFTINNIGDPYFGNNGIHTCDFETEVIDFFAELLCAPSQDYWGYITNGGTEGNLYGLYLGRESYPDGIIYHSTESHYSVPKAARLLGLKNVAIPTVKSGEMDYDKFKTVVSSLSKFPVIVNANIGTTMKGAIDNIETILKILNELNIDRYYVHCDAALFGVMLPFLQSAPAFDFRMPIGSIAISGHKFLGSPVPCGIAISRKRLLSRIGGNIEYIGSSDKTISGSRDGFSALLLWRQLMRYGKEGLRKSVFSCLELTNYTLEKLSQINWPAWANRFSNIVVIQRPSDKIVAKWNLATEGEYSHVVLMPGTNGKTIDNFVADLAQCTEMATAK